MNDSANTYRSGWDHDSDYDPESGASDVDQYLDRIVFDPTAPDLLRVLAILTQQVSILETRLRER